MTYASRAEGPYLLCEVPQRLPHCLAHTLLFFFGGGVVSCLSCIFLLLFKYSCLHFPPTTPPNPRHPHLPPSIVPPFGVAHVSFIHVPDNPSPPFPPLSPPTSPLATVSLFLISMSLVIVCLLCCFVDYVPLTDEITWYLSFTTWLISLSIILCISIHAVTKDRNSCFLSAT